MAKITDYIENPSPDPETVFKVIAYGGQNYKVKLGNFGGVDQHKRQIPIVAEFLGIVSPGLTIGASNTISTEANHPGFVTNGNYPALSYYTLTFIGGETMEFIAKPAGAGSGLYIGFGCPTNYTDPGASFIAMSMGSSGVSGHCSNLGTKSVTPSNISTLSTSSWYRFKISVNSTLNRVDFFVYDTSSNLLWSDSVSTNIPSVVTDVSLHIFVTLTNSIDWLTIYNTTVFDR